MKTEEIQITIVKRVSLSAIHNALLLLLLLVTGKITALVLMVQAHRYLYYIITRRTGKLILLSYQHGIWKMHNIPPQGFIRTQSKLHLHH